MTAANERSIPLLPTWGANNGYANNNDEDLNGKEDSIPPSLTKLSKCENMACRS